VACLLPKNTEETIRTVFRMIERPLTMATKVSERKILLKELGRDFLVANRKALCPLHPECFSDAQCLHVLYSQTKGHRSSEALLS